ncbi:MAG: 5-(carboxyamino)imidazole ribonucleotide mutase [Actinobacteria bacterium]|nr:5-(carboxyamino)imidazole ribonucleotide mutase [Actinomycetota bacterium]
MSENKKLVAIIMGSKSDEDIMKGAEDIFKEFGIKYEKIISSAHRMPEKTSKFAKNLKADGFEVVIAGAGKAAHLPGVIASYTTLPVIGVPIKTDDLGGLDSLLSIVQMPAGVPVATVAINGAKNAAILAIQILSLKYLEINKKFEEYKSGLAN